MKEEISRAYIILNGQWRLPMWKRRDMQTNKMKWLKNENPLVCLRTSRHDSFLRVPSLLKAVKYENESELDNIHKRKTAVGRTKQRWNEKPSYWEKVEIFYKELNPWVKELDMPGIKVDTSEQVDFYFYFRYRGLHNTCCKDFSLCRPL